MKKFVWYFLCNVGTLVEVSSASRKSAERRLRKHGVKVVKLIAAHNGVPNEHEAKADYVLNAAGLCQYDKRA